MLLPGDRSVQQDQSQMLRVNHAGEYGARRIYDGQLAVLRGRPSYETIAKMKAQEELHLQTFEQLLRTRRVRPTALMPLWHVGGYVLGAATALMGEKAAMACTVAVEEVISDHYAAQEARLSETGEDAPLRETIASFRADEEEHHATGLDHGAEQAPLYDLLHDTVRNITRAAIWLSTRI